jgi:ankyrin repeat protein
MIRDEWEKNCFNKEWIKNRLKIDPEEINTRLKNDFTPLIRAVQMKMGKELIRFLLENGADVNAATKFNDTAFCWAVVNGKIEIVKLLVEYGANIQHKKDGKNNVFKHSVNDEMFRYLVSIGLLINEGLDFNSSYYVQIIMKNHDVVDEHLELQSEEFIRWYKGKRIETLF